MKRNKGFTLIELLAVIVILAILALIAIPIVIKIISDSRESSHKRSIESYGRNVENAIMSYMEQNDENDIPKTLSSYQIKMSGEKVKCKDEFEYEDSKLTLYECVVVDKKGNPKSDVYTYENRKATKVGEKDSNSSSSYKEYHIGDEIYDKPNNEKYYVISDSDSNQDYVTALKAELLMKEEIDNNNYGQGYINKYTYYDVGRVSDSNGYGAVAFYSSSTCGRTNYGFYSDGCESENASSYDNSDIKHVIDDWEKDKFKNNELELVDGYPSRLITKDELVDNLGCTSSTCHYSSYKWLYSDYYSYWTMSPSDFSKIWIVVGGGSINDSMPYGFYGVSSIRPVINLRKQYIQ